MVLPGVFGIERIPAAEGPPPKLDLAERLRRRLQRKEQKRQFKKLWSQRPKNRLVTTVRKAIVESLRASSSGPQGSMQKALGYSWMEFRRHVERQFVDGMTWENRSLWHVDHIRPLASFHFETKDDPEFRAAWALTNLRPLWAMDNMRKGSRWSGNPDAPLP